MKSILLNLWVRFHIKGAGRIGGSRGPFKQNRYIDHMIIPPFYPHHLSELESESWEWNTRHGAQTGIRHCWDYCWGGGCLPGHLSNKNTNSFPASESSTTTNLPYLSLIFSIYLQQNVHVYHFVVTWTKNINLWG